MKVNAVLAPAFAADRILESRSSTPGDGALSGLAATAARGPPRRSIETASTSTQASADAIHGAACFRRARRLSRRGRSESCFLTGAASGSARLICRYRIERCEADSSRLDALATHSSLISRPSNGSLPDGVDTAAPSLRWLGHSPASGAAPLPSLSASESGWLSGQSHGLALDDRRASRRPASRGTIGAVGPRVR